MVFQGDVRSVGELLAASFAAHAPSPNTRIGVRHTAADSALTCRALLTDGQNLDDCWRFGVLQTLDHYTSAMRRGGAELASDVFAEEPPRTGAPQLDAAFAALAEFLALRDGWIAPDWCTDPDRQADGWYPAVPAIFRADADSESPEPFRRRGILITSRSLARA